MRFLFSSFTHIGTQRDVNQDRILVQGSVIGEGLHSFPAAEDCICFVADGIGGGPCGDLAAQFVLEEIRDRVDPQKDYTQEELENILTMINNDLIELGQIRNDCQGMATTLVGMIAGSNRFNVINAGDSQAYVYRNNNMIKLTEDHLLDPFDYSSPVTSYFGGRQSELRLDFDTVLREIIVGDIFLLASDGLFKSLSVRQVKAILSNSKPLIEKAEFMLQKALELGAEDNISTILIEVIE